MHALARARFALLGGLAIGILILVAVRSNRSAKLTIEQQETNEAIKLLLATGDDPQASAGLQANGNRAGVRPSAELTFNVAVVLSGIIIVAVSLDPGENSHGYLTEQHSYESDFDHNPLLGHQRSAAGDDFELEFDSGGEFNDEPSSDMAADFDGERPDFYQFDAEAQVWSPASELGWSSRFGILNSV
ncbi:hypothetical protein M3Y99_00175700 [Aphelenchoides fujianensis]|nr:hypothetical protein M3Y99_00175700 [Aphelenchoides fujianensis]